MMHKIRLYICGALLLASAAISIEPSLSAQDVKAEIIQRCKSDMGDYGAAMVKACVDQDIEALRSLNKYPDKYSNIVGRCFADMQEYGYAMVKACSDQDINASDALENY